MKFGKYLRRNQVVEWSSAYVDYDHLKQRVDSIVEGYKRYRSREVTKNQLNQSRRDLMQQHESTELILRTADEMKNPRSVRENSGFGGNDLPRVAANPDDPVSREIMIAHAKQYALEHKAEPSALWEQNVPQNCPARHEEELFFIELQKEYQKVNQFFQKQEDFFYNHINTATGLEERIRELRAQFDAESAGDKEHKLAKLNQKMNRLRHGCRELYRGLELLNNFRVLNYAAFNKILKKHDKNSDFKAAPLVMPVIIRSAFFSSSRLNNLINTVERIFGKLYDKKDKHQALLKLKAGDQKLSHLVTFELGVLAGLGMCLLAVLLFIVRIIPSVESNSYFFAPFPVFRGTGLVLLALLLYGCMGYFWTRYRINYPFIFQMESRSRLSYAQVLVAAGRLMILWLAMFTLYLLSWARGDQGQEWLDGTAYIHLSLFVAFWAALLWPFDYFYRKSRLFLLRALRNVFVTPILPVGFMEFFLADQLVSLVTVFLDVTYSFCFYSTRDYFVDNDGDACKDFVSSAAWIVAILPAWWRLGQCLKRFSLTRQAHPHLTNSGKYCAGILVTLASKVASTNSEFVPVWVALAFFGTCYSYTWDIVMDWGLLEGGLKNYRLHDGLRAVRVVEDARVYYFAMTSNLLLRVAWVLTISPDALGLSFNRELVVLLVAALEVFRRFQWNFFRLENEHLNNVGQFRAVKEIPLLNEDENHDEEPELSHFDEHHVTHNVQNLRQASMLNLGADGHDDDPEDDSHGSSHSNDAKDDVHSKTTETIGAAKDTSIKEDSHNDDDHKRNQDDGPGDLTPSSQIPELDTSKKEDTDDTDSSETPTPKQTASHEAKHPAVSHAAATADTTLTTPRAGATTDTSLPMTPRVTGANASWSSDQVARWVKASGFPDYHDNFLKNEIDGEAMWILTSGELCQALGLPLGHATKILMRFKTQQTPLH